LLLYLTGNIFIPSVETLSIDDPFEGKFHFETGWFNTAMRHRYGDAADALENWICKEFCSEQEKKDMKQNGDYLDYAANVIQNRYFAFLKKTRYAWCWFHSDSESAAMWNNYGKQGVAIATTVGKLKGLIEETNRNFAFGRMRYIHLIGGEVRDFNLENPFDAHFLLTPHFLKRNEYRSENEVRFVTSAPENECVPGITLENVNPMDWITNVRLWPGLKPLEEASLKKVIQGFIPGIPCACSDLYGADASWGIEGFTYNMLKDFGDFRFSAWCDGKDNIPPELKEL